MNSIAKLILEQERKKREAADILRSLKIDSITNAADGFVVVSIKDIDKMLKLLGV